MPPRKIGADDFDEIEGFGTHDAPTSDAEPTITVGKWVSIPKSMATPQVVGMAFNIPGPGITSWLGTNAGAADWTVITIVLMQVIGFIAMVAMSRKRRRRRPR